MIKVEYILLHEDCSFPIEEEWNQFFMPSFWNAPEYRCTGAEFYFTAENPAHWNSFELECMNSEGETNGVFRIESFRERTDPQSANYTENDIREIIAQFKKGTFQSIPEVRNIQNWAVTALILETEDPRFRKEFYRTVERFMSFTKAVVVYPELMNVEEFRRFHSLSPDVVEQEQEPEEDH